MDITMVAGSLPAIVTSGNNRRINRDEVNNPVVKNYIDLIGKLLSIKKDIKDIKMAYISGYTGVESVNTAKLYLAAINYYLKEYGYGELDKNNFTIVDIDSFNKDWYGIKDKIQNADFLFLGIGDDKLFIELIELLEKYNVNIKEYVKSNNMVVSSACAGSVISASKIYGGKYDSFYHDREIVSYPDNFSILGINKVTMEPNLYPISSTNDKNKEFKDTCLLPDSYNISFFGCKQNSFMFMSGNVIYAVGEVYLFIDGEDILISNSLEYADISVLNKLINEYNLTHDKEIKEKIKKALLNLKRKGIVEFLTEDVTDSFLEEENDYKKRMMMRKCFLRLNLVSELINIFYGSRCIEVDIQALNSYFINSLNLDSDNEYEVFLKFWMIKLVKRYSNMYKENISKYFNDLYEIMDELVIDEPLIVYYFIACFSSMYENSKSKKLLAKTKVENNRKVSALNNNNLYRKRLWRTENVS